MRRSQLAVSSPAGRGRVALGMVAAVGFPLIALVLTRSLGATLFVLFIPAAIGASAIGGIAAGWVAVGVSIALIDAFVLHGGGRLHLDTEHALVGLVAFTVVALFTVGLYAREREARTNAEEERRRADRARQRLASLSSASQALARSFDVEENLAFAARIAVDQLGDRAEVYVPDDRGRLIVVAAAARDPSVASAEDGAAIAVNGRDPVARSYATHRSQRGDGPIMAFPLLSAEQCLGVLAIAYMANGEEPDAAFAQELARRMARAVELSRLYRERDEIASVLQRSLLPGSTPHVPGIEIAARYEAAGQAYDVGGDFYDVIETDHGWVFAVGDAAGKGPGAAALMGFVRASLRAAALQEPDPARILELLNEAVLSRGGSRFCTVACVRVVPGDHTLRVTCAAGGHPRPVIIRSDGRAALLGEHGTLIGAFHGAVRVETTVTVGAGETLVLYTDGLERPGASAEDVAIEVLAGEGGLSPGAVIRHLEAARDASSRREQDDLALLALSPSVDPDVP